MQIAPQLSSQLKQIDKSFIQASFYDPTTYYLGDNVFDRDEFKQLKKEGLIEVSFQDMHGRRYSLSNKGRQFMKAA